MKNEVMVQGSDAARLVALEECEEKIKNAFRRGLEATLACAREFRKIKEDELFLERGCKSFNEYAQYYLRVDLSTVYRIDGISDSIENLRGAGLPLPTYESHAAELCTLKEPALQLEAWKRALDASDKLEQPVTTKLVRKAVEGMQEQVALADAAPHIAAARPGVTTALDLEGEAEPARDGGAAVNGEPRRMTPAPAPLVPPEVTFSDSGEAALERVARLCGKVVGEAIRTGNLPISERELERWAGQEDDMVKTLAHYVSNQRWKVSKALAFEDKAVEDLTVLELEKQAKARGGKLILRHADALLTVELSA